MSDDVVRWALDTGRIRADRETDWRAALSVDPPGIAATLRTLPPPGIPRGGAPTSPAASFSTPPAGVDAERALPS